MKTIEDKLHIAHELGRIAGASECIEDESTRTTIYQAAESLFDGLLTEAEEDLRTDAAYWKQKYEDAIEPNKPRLGGRPTRDYPPDPFDFVETGEMAEKEPEPKKRTNIEWLCDNPEELAARIYCPYDYCIHMDEAEVSGDDACRACVLDWLCKEATPDE